MEAAHLITLMLAVAGMIGCFYAAWLWGCLLNIAAADKNTRLARRAGLVLLTLALAAAVEGTILIQTWSALND